MERHTRSAQELVDRLRAHPAVELVRYPGLRRPALVRRRGRRGGAEGRDLAQDDTNATSLGGVESVLESRSRWEGDRVPPGLLRLSVGLEDADELWADLEQALA
jgi:cystathionine gamma-synthase